MSRWIVPTGNGEIPPIIELPPVFSVEIAVAGAKNGCFWIEMQGYLCQAWWYGIPMLIEVRGDLCVGVWSLGLTIVALVVVEIWGEVSPLWEIRWRSLGGEW